eukprot:COSAG03_NODE_9012_length_752_cov_1.022971_2_plen_24_part_01
MLLQRRVFVHYVCDHGVCLAAFLP